jgi:hypothetical protein
LAISKGVVIVAVSQCLRGRVDLRAYALGRALEDIGVIGAGDTSTESVVTKLAFLLSWPDSRPELVRHYMGLSLRGELTEGSNASTGPHSGDWASSRLASGDVFFSGLGRRLEANPAGAGGAAAASSESIVSALSTGAAAAASPLQQRQLSPPPPPPAAAGMPVAQPTPPSKPRLPAPPLASIAPTPPPRPPPRDAPLPTPPSGQP